MKKIFFKYILLSLSFIAFPLLISGMEVDKNVEKSFEQKADKQLLKLIGEITLDGRHTEHGFTCSGFAYNGEKIFRGHDGGNYSCPMTNKLNDYHDLKDTSYLWTKPIESMVLTHIHGTLKKPGNKYHLYDPCDYDEEYRRKYYRPKNHPPLTLDNHINWKGPVKIISITQEKKELIQNANKNKETLKELLYGYKIENNTDKLNALAFYLLYDPKSPICNRQLKKCTDCFSILNGIYKLKKNIFKIDELSKLNIIKLYIPSAKQERHKNKLKNLNKNFETYLKENFSFEIFDYSDKVDTLKQNINMYLKKKGNIILPLKYCVLKNDALFSNEVNAASLLEKYKKFAEWLLVEKCGQHYIDKLFSECARIKIIKDEYGNITRTENTNKKIFMRCLSLVRAYRLLKPACKQLEPVICEMAYFGKVEWLKTIIDINDLNLKNEKKILSTALPHVFCKVDTAINQEHLKQEHLEIIRYLISVGATDCIDDALVLAGMLRNFSAVEVLLDSGADPNRLFYKDGNNKKRCYLRKAWYQNTLILMSVLSHPDRNIEPDEPTDFEYLTHKKDQKFKSTLSMFDISFFSFLNYYSFFDNKKMNKYNYSMKVLKLALKARRKKKKEDIQKVRNHVITRYKQGWIGYIDCLLFGTKVENGIRKKATKVGLIASAFATIGIGIPTLLWYKYQNSESDS